MYLNILKKDLKRKKTMNMILLVFIILATMFVASGLNNVFTVMNGTDYYLDKAEIGDFVVITMGNESTGYADGILDKADCVNGYKIETCIFGSQDSVSHLDGAEVETKNTAMFQSISDAKLKFFNTANKSVSAVNQGEVLITGKFIENNGFKVGDYIRIKLGDVEKELKIAGKVKDAFLGSDFMGNTRFLLNQADYDTFLADEMINAHYLGEVIYIETDDVKATTSAIADIPGIAFTGTRDTLKMCYVMEMIVAFIILILSVCLIIVSFVVLRFSIGFTIAEEYREIGVMKAIGISNVKIRGLYLVKYTALSVIGAVIGLILSFPFGEMLKNVWSKTIIISGRNVIIINILCAVFVVAVIMLFCYGCTGKVKRLSPIDAIRNGQTGERFRKKCLIGMSKSRLGAVPFMAVNDIVSSPKRYGIVTLTFVLCLSIMLMLSGTVSTLKSKSLITTFGLADCDVVLFGEQTLEFMADDGRQKADEYLADMEKTLSENGMPANCFSEFIFYLSVMHGENERKVNIYQGINTGMDKYSYLSGTAPQRNGEIAITQITANKLEASIGDNVTIRTMEGSKEYIITALYQTMYNQGEGVRLYTDENISYVYANGKSETQIKFTDNPGDDEIQRRIKKIAELYPDIDRIITCGEFVTENVGVAETLNTIKQMVTILSVILTALITVLMERSFIAKEQGEIALMKAVGMRNGSIYAYHTLRFAIVGMVAVIVAVLLAVPFLHIFIDPVFKMMGMEIGVEYVFDIFEMYLLFPLVILLTTTVSAFLTSLYTRKIKSSDTANIE